MHRIAVGVTLALLALAVPGCHRGMVRLRTEPGAEQYEWRSPLAAEEFRSPCLDLPYAIEAPVGYSDARKQPLVGFAVKARIRWNSAIEPMSAYFDELSARHNAGQVTVREFEARAEDLTAAVEELLAWRAELGKALEEHDAAEAATEKDGGQKASRPTQAALDMALSRDAVGALIGRATRRVNGLAESRTA